MIRPIVITCAAAVALSGCMTATAIETKRLPTAAEAQAQLQADITALQAIGCLTATASDVAQPIIQAEVDANGQRIASAIDTASGRVCSGPSKTVIAQ